MIICTVGRTIDVCCPNRVSSPFPFTPWGGIMPYLLKTIIEFTETVVA